MEDGEGIRKIMAMNSILQQELLKIVKGNIRFNEPLRDHTTIKIGGPADVWFEPADIDDLINIIKWIDEREIPRMIFGNGSNTLVKDNGIRGLVVSLAKLDKVEFLPVSGANETIITAEAGVHLQHLLSLSVEKSLTGFEPLTGIPGTVGGAVIMNAGTGEGTIADTIRSIKVITRHKLTTIQKSDLEFSYRKLKLPRGAVVVLAEFLLKEGIKTEIEGKISKIRHKRGEVQPLLWPNMGSVFKNPSNSTKAWQLIEDCGLRGVRVGGARVSNEHANWIVNEGKATAKDVELLIRLIREKVKEKSDVNLEPEVMIVGE